MTFSIYFYVFLFLFVATHYNDFHCLLCLFIEKNSFFLQVVHGAQVHDEPQHIIRKRSIDHPIRILLYYDDSVYRYVFVLWQRLSQYKHSIIK